MSTLRITLIKTISQVLKDSGRSVANIQETDALTGTLGLNSLDLAVVVVRLEQELGVDPFRDGQPMVATFGDLVALYEQAGAKP